MTLNPFHHRDVSDASSRGQIYFAYETYGFPDWRACAVPILWISRMPYSSSWLIYTTLPPWHISRISQVLSCTHYKETSGLKQLNYNFSWTAKLHYYNPLWKNRANTLDLNPIFWDNSWTVRIHRSSNQMEVITLKNPLKEILILIQSTLGSWI